MLQKNPDELESKTIKQSDSFLVGIETGYTKYDKSWDDIYIKETKCDTVRIPIYFLAAVGEETRLIKYEFYSPTWVEERKNYNISNKSLQYCVRKLNDKGGNFNIQFESGGNIDIINNSIVLNSSNILNYNPDINRINPYGKEIYFPVNFPYKLQLKDANNFISYLKNNNENTELFVYLPDDSEILFPIGTKIFILKNPYAESIPINVGAPNDTVSLKRCAQNTIKTVTITEATAYNNQNYITYKYSGNVTFTKNELVSISGLNTLSGNSLNLSNQKITWSYGNVFQVQKEWSFQGISSGTGTAKTQTSYDVSMIVKVAANFWIAY